MVKRMSEEEIYEEAKKIEENLRKFIEQSKPTAPSLPPIPSYMYG